MIHMVDVATAYRGLAAAAILLIAMTVAAPAQQVVALVNGEPITALDVEQRIKFTQLTTHKSPARADVINELIDEKLMVREGKRWGMELSDSEVDGMFANLGRGSRMTADQLVENLMKNGINPNTVKARLRAQNVWQQLVRGRYQSSLQIPDKDVEIALAARNEAAQDNAAVEYTMRPILLLVPPGSSSAAVDAKRKEAETLRGRFKTCEEGLPVARAMGVIVRDQVIRNSGELPAELRKVLDAVPIGQLTAPEITKHGIEMWAICGKQDSKADSASKRQARDKIFSERFEKQSKAYLQRLRLEALIERK
jgi:peptidyl-prolyl cis-trans isomerase SurA